MGFSVGVHYWEVVRCARDGSSSVSVSIYLSICRSAISLPARRAAPAPARQSNGASLTRWFLPARHASVRWRTSGRSAERGKLGAVAPIV